MVNRWFGVGQFLSGAMGQLYPGGDKAVYTFLFSQKSKISARTIQLGIIYIHPISSTLLIYLFCPLTPT